MSFRMASGRSCAAGGGWKSSAHWKASSRQRKSGHGMERMACGCQARATGRTPGGPPGPPGGAYRAPPQPQPSPAQPRAQRRQDVSGAERPLSENVGFWAFSRDLDGFGMDLGWFRWLCGSSVAVFWRGLQQCRPDITDML